MTSSSTELLSTFIQNISFEGLLVLDNQGLIVQHNAAASRLLSDASTTADLVGRSGLEVLEQLPSGPHADRKQRDHLKHLLAVAADDKENHKEDQSVAINQQRQAVDQWLRIKRLTFTHDSQQYIGLEVRDITAARQLEMQKSQQLAEIADQNRQWQAMFNGVQESIVLLDEHGYVVTINPATERITGRKSSEVIGQHVGQLFPKIDTVVPGLDRFGRSGFDQVLQDRRPSDLFETVVETKDHRHIWINYTYTPLMDPKGELIGFIRVTSDVSTVKAVDQMKNDFISIASHELRTPLGVINSYLNLFLNNQLGPLTDDQRVFIQRIYNSSGDMSALVEDLLNMSRIEDGRIEIAVQPFAMVDLVQEVLSHLEPRYINKQIKVDIRDQTSKVVVYADRQKVEQALTNLIDNAIKYTYDNGAITIDIAQADQLITVSVTDSGVGIRPENLTHIFEKFYREGNPLSIKEGGSGLGLYISRKLIELHGGSITASSTHNQGSTFTVQLPLAPVAPTAVTAPNQQQKGD